VNEIVIKAPEPSEFVPGFLQIVNRDTYIAAAERRIYLGKLRRKIAEEFAPSKSAAHKAHAEICAFERKTLAPIDAETAEIDRQRFAYEREQRRLAEIETARLIEAARKEDKERREEIALASIGEVDDADIDAMLDAPFDLALTVAPDIPKIEGLGAAKPWEAEVSDFASFATWAVKHGRFELLAVNDSALRALAKSTRGTQKLPGVRFFEKAHAVVRK
jgi:hypothetical protein